MWSNGRIEFRNILFRSSRSSRVGPEAVAVFNAGPEFGGDRASPLARFIEDATANADGVCCGWVDGKD